MFRPVPSKRELIYSVRSVFDEYSMYLPKMSVVAWPVRLRVPNHPFGFNVCCAHISLSIQHGLIQFIFSLPVANQLRSINYQLSNLKYMQEGWTVRPKSPIDFDQINFNDIEYNLMAQAVVSEGEPRVSCR